MFCTFEPDDSKNSTADQKNPTKEKHHLFQRLAILNTKNESMDCKAFSERRFKCHSVYGKGGEDCLNEELTEKRCLSLYHCPNQAREYYGSAAMDLKSDDGQAPAFMSDKALCASWAESFAYVDKALEYGENVAEHHRDAQIVVSKDKVLKRECRDIAFSLARCLRNKKLF